MPAPFLCDRLNVGGCVARDNLDASGAKDPLTGVDTIEVFPFPRVDMDRDPERSGRPLPFSISVSSRFNDRSEVRPPPRGSEGPSVVPTSSKRRSFLEFTAVSFEVLTSPTLRPANPETLWTSAADPCKPLPLALVDVDEARRSCPSCAVDKFEFWRARDGCAR